MKRGCEKPSIPAKSSETRLNFVATKLVDQAQRRLFLQLNGTFLVVWILGLRQKGNAVFLYDKGGMKKRPQQSLRCLFRSTYRQEQLQIARFLITEIKKAISRVMSVQSKFGAEWTDIATGSHQELSTATRAKFCSFPKNSFKRH